MDKLEKLLKDYQKRHGLGQALTAARVVTAANAVARDRYRAVSFRDGRLRVEVPAGPALFFLRKDKKNIIAAINERLSSNVVEDLIIRPR